MVSIKDLYDDLHTLVNQKHYTKTESDEKFIQDLEINVNTDTGKLYIVTEKQTSLTLTSNTSEVSTGDTITLTATLKDKNNNGISNVRVDFKKGNTIIGSSFTNNNGIATLTYTVNDEDNFTVTASTRYLHSSNINITISQLNQIRLKLKINSDTCRYEDDYDEYSYYSDSPYYYFLMNGEIGSVDWGDGTTSKFSDYHYYYDEGEYDVVIYTNEVTYLYDEFWDVDALVSFDASDCLTLTELGGDSLEMCNNLETVILPPSLTYINGLQFYDGSNLSSITFMSTTPPTAYQDSFVNIPSDCVIYVPQGCLSAYTSASNYPDPNTYTYVVNDNYIELNTTNLTTISSKSLLSYGSVSEYIIYWGDGTSGTYSRTSMPSHEYSSSGNYKIIITSDELITRSGKYGSMTEITNVKLPESITRIDTEAFIECSNLTNINIPNSVTEINSSAFSNCPNLTQLELGENITYIDSYAFAYSGLTSINIPSSVTDIGDSFAYNCPNLTRMYFHWENSEDIVEYYYDKDWWGGASSSFKIIIPQGTRSLYVAKNYPNELLQEASS